jgi:hypothetical protein
VTRRLPRRLILPAVVAAAALAQACMAADPGTRAGCTVLMGGFGTMTQDAAINGRWLGLDSDLSHAVGDKLGKAGYRMSDFTVYLPDAKLRAKALEDTVYKTGCHRVLQISFDLGGGKSKDAPQSGFVVSVSHLDEFVAADGKSRTLKITEVYNTEYEYLPDRAKKPTLEALAQSVTDDLAKAGVLAD